MKRGTFLRFRKEAGDQPSDDRPDNSEERRHYEIQVGVHNDFGDRARDEAKTDGPNNM